MDYHIVLPPAELAAYVKYFWQCDHRLGTSQPMVIHKIVDDSSGIIIQRNSRGDTAFFNSDHTAIAPALIYGKFTKPLHVYAGSSYESFGVTLTSHGLHTLFGIDADEMTNRCIAIADFFGPTAQERLIFCDKRNRITLLRDFLREHIRKGNTADTLLLHCVQAIKDRRGHVGIKDLLEKYDISERRLERKFRQQIGVSPKLFTRIIKFQHAMDHLTKQRGGSLCEIAHELDYIDQSRFIRYVREFSGYTPNIIRKNSRDFLMLGEDEPNFSSLAT